jgi:hypothetical protein
MAGAEPRDVCEGPGEPVEQHQELLDESGDCPESFLAGVCKHFFGLHCTD